MPSTLHTLGLAFRSPGQVGDYIRYLPEVVATGLGPNVLRKKGEVGFQTLRYAAYELHFSQSIHHVALSLFSDRGLVRPQRTLIFNLCSDCKSAGAGLGMGACLTL